MTEERFGYCECGCGGKTKISPKTDRRAKWVKGEPLRFIHGHFKRGALEEKYQVDPASGCWVWRAGKDTCGYGLLTINRKHHRASRFFYEQKFGPIPENLCIDHICRNRACVNPDHLRATTFVENIRCGAVVKLTPDQVRNIRERYPIIRSLKTLAKEYGVWPATISSIINGKTWIGV